MAKCAIVALLGLLHLAHAFYLPGVAPRRFLSGEQHYIKVNTMTSPMNPLRFDYFSVQDAFCMPEGGVEEQRENLGEVLAGEPRSPIDPDPRVCRFFGRCPKQVDRCRHEAPLLHTVGEGHQAACHFV